MLINNREVNIIYKNVKNISLRVYPNLDIKLVVPTNTSMDRINRVLISKDEWITNKIDKYFNQIRIGEREYVSGEDIYLNGKRHILKVVDSNKPGVFIKDNNHIVLNVRKGSSNFNKEKIINNFYKEQLQKKLDKYMPIWEEKIKVKPSSFEIRKMKNRWGNCNQTSKIIIFNLYLAQKDDFEIQYVIIHELIHLIERHHNENFKSLMNKYYPKWKDCQITINNLLG